jgi:hypothetical protein
MKPNLKIARHKKGVSSLFITIYIALLAIMLMSTLFVGLNIARSSTNSYLEGEQARMQEGIQLSGPNGMRLLEDKTTVESILVKNTGSITVRIRALYINGVFTCDPSLGGDTYIAPKESLWVSLIALELPRILISEDNLNVQWSMATERGTESSETAARLLYGPPITPPPSNAFYIGPFMILFDMFNARIGNGDWAGGWTIHSTNDVVTWRILLTNVDKRAVVIESNSFFDLFGNEIQSNKEQQWYIHIPQGQNSITLAPGEYAFIYFNISSTGADGINGFPEWHSCTNFLVFTGHFEDSSQTRYGQTIPFEAVLVTPPPTLNIVSAAPNPIYIGLQTQSKSTITVQVTDPYGQPMENFPVTFTSNPSDIGILSDFLTVTNSSGQATVTLDAGLKAGTTKVTAKCQDMQKSVDITIIASQFPTTTALNIISSPLIAGQVVVPFTGKITASQNVPDGQNVILEYSRTGGSPWTAATTVTTSSGTGAFSGSFTAPITAGTYYFRANFPGALLGNTWSSSISTQQIVLDNHASAYAITVAPGSASATAGAKQTYTATASDAYANTWDVSSSTSWSIDSSAAGSWSSNVYTSAKAGTWTVTGTYSGKSGTASLTVNHAAVNSITVSPSSATINVGTSQTYSATASDAYGNTWTATGLVTWSISGSAGTWTTNTVTATKAGTWTVTATLNGVSGTASLTANPSVASVLVVSGFPSPITAGNSGSVTITAKDIYGNTVANYAGTVHFTSSDGQAVLPSNYVFQPSDNGVHTFTNGVTLKTSGTQSITATDVTTPTITGSQTGIQINPASASILLVSGFPSPRTAGAAGSVTVTAKDVYGNTATGYRGRVHFTSSDSQAIAGAGLPSDYTFIAGDNGVHVFTNGVTLKTAGTQSITVADTVTSSITGTQSPISITPGALNRFAFNTITNQARGIAFSITITAVDQFGNLLASYSQTNTLSASNGVNIAPSVTTNFSNGVWTGLVTLTKNNGASGMTMSTTGLGASGTSNPFNLT